MFEDSQRFYTTESLDSSKPLFLPRIHDVLGDMLEKPVWPDRSKDRLYNSRIGPSPSSSRVVTPAIILSSPMWSLRSVPEQKKRSTLPVPPEKSHSPSAQGPPHHYRSFRDVALAQTSLPEDFSFQEESVRSHSYDVFVITAEQRLDHRRSSIKDDHHDVMKEVAISTSSGKYVCVECGRRFQKNSTLKVGLPT
ncbi:hypothetical protein K439DRAFT_1616145 [Ramaria rubella]|nr:hypothetical protein K439DRAFT_1616145 [Ramaria rubella]